MNRSCRRVGLPALAAVIALVAASCTPPPPPPPAPVVANAVPLANTPNFTGPAVPVGVAGPTVKAIAQVGDRMVVGGSFTAVNSVTHKYLATFVAPAGPVDAFAPQLNNVVDVVTPTAGATGYYAAGLFTSVGGFGTRVALFTTAGALVTSFRVIANGEIRTMAVNGTHLLLGGTFTNVDGATRNGLASVNTTTGALDSYLTVSLTGHHNFGHIDGAAEGGVGAFSLAVSPDHSRAIVDGNFTDASGFSRDQIVNITLNAANATVDPNWATPAYTHACSYKGYDSYVQDIAWSPDGSYFVVSATGGYKSGSLEDCDSATRFNASSTGLSVQPAWIDWTGTDSLYSVAVTAAAVYVGGHNRWLNNPFGQDNPHAGAVPRPGLAALEPANGVPLSWNPGRHPRGHGAEVVYASPTGIWVGSDTNYIGNFAYQRDELAFFPFAGGTPAAGDATGNPTKIYVGGRGGSSSNVLSANSFNPATGAGRAIPAPSNGGIDWSQIRGAFMLNGRVWYGKSDGTFNYRTYDGTIFGPEERVDPYNDPYWSPVVNGSPPTGSTYRGTATSFYAQLPELTAMFYANRAIYYTLQGDSRLYRRAFSPGTAGSSVPGQVTGGIISPIQVTVVASGGLVDFSAAGGLWVAGTKLWMGSSHSGALYEIPWNGFNVIGKAVQPPASTNPNPNAPGNVWAGRGVFVSP
jgi:hypothetical protein